MGVDERADEREFLETLSKRSGVKAPSRAIVVALRLVQVTTVSVVIDSQLAVTGSLCWRVFKTRNDEMALPFA